MSKPTVYLIPHIEQGLHRARVNRDRAILRYEMIRTAIQTSLDFIEGYLERTRERNKGMVN
jgi:hypothetical protein